MALLPDSLHQSVASPFVRKGSVTRRYMQSWEKREGKTSVIGSLKASFKYLNLASFINTMVKGNNNNLNRFGNKKRLLCTLSCLPHFVLIQGLEAKWIGSSFPLHCPDACLFQCDLKHQVYLTCFRILSFCTLWSKAYVSILDMKQCMAIGQSNRD